MTDQQRYDTIAALGHAHIQTPNLDRLVRRGVTFNRGYSTCPVCVPARYTVRTGCEPPRTGSFANGWPKPAPDQPKNMEERCGPYLARTMGNLGYRTFGVGKFHTVPWREELGYETQLHSEEVYFDRKQRSRDAYRRWLSEHHPYFDWLEQVHGERSEMYYMPQMSPMPAQLTVESWAADRAVELIAADDPRPYFGFVSFIGPHPPLAPPLPFNRLYDPMDMPLPVRGERALDHLDEHLPWMNYLTWSEDVDAARTAVLRARYCAEITYIDRCLGRILDAVEARPDADNTLICFFSDHGDHLGDHHAWQKESFFDVSCRVPFLLSWPERIDADRRRDELVCLTDLFAIASGAAGHLETRDGIDVLGVLAGRAQGRERLIGWYGHPGTHRFKMMVIEGDWKYIYLANGGGEQLFNLRDDPWELRQRLDDQPALARRLRNEAVRACRDARVHDALEADDLRQLPFEARPLQRLKQFDTSSGVNDYARDLDALAVPGL